MKKLLLGTSAIALAGVIAAPASAAEWSMKVSGSMEQHMAFGSSDNDNITGDFNGIDNKSDQEIHFSPSITLDNGLKFGARVELEGATSGDQIDETYLYISGSFGRVVLGENDNAANTMAYSAPDVTFFGINSGSDTLWLPFAEAFGTTTTFVGVEGDSAGIQYYTPRVAGIQLGVSYARDANRSTDDGQKDEDAAGKTFNIFGIGANYSKSFGDVSIAMSGGYTTGSRNPGAATTAAKGLIIGPVSGESAASIHEYSCGDDFSNIFNAAAGFNTGITDADIVVAAPCTAAAPGSSGADPEVWTAGLVVGFGDFSIGGAYSDENNNGGAGGDMVVYEVGAAYQPGPWGISFGYLRAERDVDGSDIDKFMIGLDYKIATGVRFGAYGVYVESDSNSGTQASDGDGFVIGTGIKVNF